MQDNLNFVSSAFQQLVGTWRIRRTIIELSGERAAVSARFVGQAVFAPPSDAAGSVSDVLDYEENGELRLRNGQRVHAVRRYLYRCGSDAWSIDFADGPSTGQRFLTLKIGDRDDGEDQPLAVVRRRSQPDMLQMTDEHLCGRDLYQAEYCFEGFDTGSDTDVLTSGTDVVANDDANANITNALLASPATSRAVRIVQRTVVSGPRKDYAIVSILTPS